MKGYEWNKDKNAILKLNRNISFEEVVAVLNGGKLLDIVNHPNQERYPNQKIFVIEIDEYIYLVPFVEDEDKIFFKTIIPSRKETKKYLMRR